MSRSDQPTGDPATAARQRTGTESASHADRAAIDQASSLARSARTFAARCHARQRRTSDGAPFVEHLLEVARLLRDAGCSDVVVAAGLLHDTVEDTRVTVADLRARFGADVADLVRTVTEDPSIESYRQRKLALREQVRSAGGDAALVFAADKISKVRELPDLVKRDRARFDDTARGRRARDHLAHDHQMRLEHYHESLDVLRHLDPQHPLVERLAEELHDCQEPRGSGELRGAPLRTQVAVHTQRPVFPDCITSS